MQNHFKWTLVFVIGTILGTLRVPAFEGHINATLTRSGPPTAVLYTVGTNWMRVEVAETNSLEPVDLVDRQSGDLILITPRTRCFMRIKPRSENFINAPPTLPGMPTGTAPSMPAMSGLPEMAVAPPPPSSIGPTGLPTPLGSTQLMPALPTMPTMPAMPAMPAMPSVPGNAGMTAMPMMPRGSSLQLQATGEQTNLLGYACARYEIRQWGQTMEIWATDQLFPFQVYQPHQPLRGGPPVIEEHWSELLAAKRLFPLLASLRFHNGVERYRFEVQSITPTTLTDREDGLFQVPADCIEIQPHEF